MEKATNVLPCPFCGSNEIYFEKYEHEVGERWRIVCAGCMAQIDTGTTTHKNHCREAWNKRVLSAEPGTQKLLTRDELQVDHDYVDVQKNKRTGALREVECSVANVEMTTGDWFPMLYGIWSNADEWETVGYYEKNKNTEVQHG